jgi:hypothetical protein
VLSAVSWADRAAGVNSFRGLTISLVSFAILPGRQASICAHLNVLIE